LIDATALVNWQRLVKSEEEIAFMRKAGADLREDRAHSGSSLSRPGLRKNELVAEITRAAILGVDEDWGDYPAIVPLTPSGMDATAPHLTWNGAPMKAGEATFFELSGCYPPLSRAVLPNGLSRHPPDDMLRASEALIEGLEAGLAAARPATAPATSPMRSVRRWRRRASSEGAKVRLSHRLSYPPDWGERTVSHPTEDETVLEPGMVFHFMPGLWIDHWGLETTETILIRDTGPAECLCASNEALREGLSPTWTRSTRSPAILGN
jgi:ectoine hydrolase